MTRLQCGLLLLLLCLTTTAGCSKATSSPDTTPGVAGEVFTTRLTPQYSSLWSITYHDGFAVLDLSAPLQSWGSTGGTNRTTQDRVVLVPRGTTPRLPGELAALPTVHIPLRTVAVNAESDEAFLTALSLDDRLIAVGGRQSWSDDTAARVDRGTLAQIGYTWHQAPNLEVLVARPPDALLTRLVNLDHATSLARARSLGIPVVPMFSWAEPTYLGDAEWIKLIGVLFGAESKAVEHFDAIVAGVNAAKRRAAEASLAGKTKALWAYYAGNQRWIVHNGGKEGAWLADAGAEDLARRLQLPWSDGGTPISTERLLEIAPDADVWIIGDPHSVDDAGTQLPPAAVLSRIKAWRERRMFHTYRLRKPERNAFAWYSLAPLQPDRVLHDLVSALYPHATPRPCEFLDLFTPPPMRDDQ